MALLNVTRDAVRIVIERRIEFFLARTLRRDLAEGECVVDDIALGLVDSSFIFIQTKA